MLEQLRENVRALQAEVTQKRSDLLEKITVARQQTYTMMKELYGEKKFPPEIQDMFRRFDQLEEEVKRCQKRNG